MTNKHHSRFLGALAAERIIAMLRCLSVQHSIESRKALVAEGIRIITMLPQYLRVVEAIEILSVHRTHILDAARDTGTVVQVDAAGARLYVPPVFRLEAVAARNEDGMAGNPGGATPTEMLRAHEARAAAIKVFPLILRALGGSPYLIKDLA